MFNDEAKGLYTLAVLISVAFIAVLYDLVPPLAFWLILVVFYSPILRWIFKKKLPKKMFKYLIKERKEVVMSIGVIGFMLGGAVIVLFAVAYSIDWVYDNKSLWGLIGLIALAFIFVDRMNGK